MTTVARNADQTAVCCAWLLNPHEAPRQNVRLSITGGIVADICDVPADERGLIQPIAVVPKLVNAHTHLEFSQLTEPIPPPSPFPDWIRSVIGYRMRNPEDRFIAEAVQSGLAESTSCGVGLVGEITTSDAGLGGLKHDDGRVVSFREIIGFAAGSLGAQLSLAAESTRLPATHNQTPGLSPHAPYSVHPELFEGVVDLARKAQLPVAMHLAETLDEIELLNRRTGRFVDFLQQLNLWDDATLGSNRSVMPYLQKLAQCRNALAIHCNYLTDDEIRFLGDNPNVAVVYCPRTHHWFGHTPHPFLKLLASGATVVLGTDSRASNPDLSIWKELQFVANLPNAKPLWELLPMVTTQAASAMGHSADEFQIAVGRRFRAVGVSCDCDRASVLSEFLAAADCRPVEVFN